MRRKTLLLTLLAAASLASLVLAGPAFAGFFSPSRAAARPTPTGIHTLYWVIFGIALVIFVGVEGALIYSLVKFRARKGAVAAQIRGNTRLEIGWTVGAAMILVALAVVTFAMLDGIREPAELGRRTGSSSPTASSWHQGPRRSCRPTASR